MIEQIVSGGQTGVDQAALLIAKELGIPIGGWCPKGGFDENQQCVSGKYSLREASTENPDERTRLNIDDSDGTLIIVPSLPMPDHITDGTNLTISYAEEQNKPNLIISLADEYDDSIESIKLWVVEHEIKILNVAGPRESSCPGINHSASSLFLKLFPALKNSSTCGYSF